MATIDHCLYVETVIRGYHVYFLNHELTLGEVCTVEHDPNRLAHDKYCMELVMCQSSCQNSAFCLLKMVES